MRRPKLEVLGMIIVLELFAAAGVKGGQYQGKAGDLTEAEVTSAAEAQWPSANAQSLENTTSSHPSSGAGAYESGGLGMIGRPHVVRRSTNRRAPLLIGLYITQGVLQGLDAQSTVRALRAGTAREGNPLVSPFASNPAALVAFKIAVAGGTIYGMDRLHKYHPRLTMATLGIINAEYAYIVQRNYRSIPAH